MNRYAEIINFVNQFCKISQEVDEETQKLIDIERNKREKYLSRQDYLDNNPEEKEKHLARLRDSVRKHNEKKMLEDADAFKKKLQENSRNKREREKEEVKAGTILGDLILISKAVAFKKKDLKKANTSEAMMKDYEADGILLYQLRDSIKNYFTTNINGKNEKFHKTTINNINIIKNYISNKYPGWKSMIKILDNIISKLS